MKKKYVGYWKTLLEKLDWQILTNIIRILGIWIRNNAEFICITYTVQLTISIFVK